MNGTLKDMRKHQDIQAPLDQERVADPSDQLSPAPLTFPETQLSSISTKLTHFTDEGVGLREAGNVWGLLVPASPHAAAKGW